MQKIQIRNLELPKKPRVFDVTVGDTGDIIGYEIQNIRGTVQIDQIEVKRQIDEALAK